VIAQDRKFFFFRACKFLSLGVVLFAASVSSASSTITVKPECVISAANFHHADTTDTISSIAYNTTNSKLADLSREFLKPPTNTTGLNEPAVCQIKSLPATPTAILTVVIGFLCVSLTRDRRIWLAALAGLLWAGQTGLHAIPRLALHISHKAHNKQKLCAKLSQPHGLDNFHHARCKVEGTEYISLLHYLAGIPHPGNISQLSLQLSTFKTFAQIDENFETSQCAIVSLPGIAQLTNFPATAAEQFISFSPAFTFIHIPRGPPILS
jgi:hypothetical protein